MYIRSRTVEGARALVRRLGSQVGFPVIAVENNQALTEATYVITASNARLPLFERDAIRRDTVVLHLGGNETPGSFIRLALEQGTVICDDMHAVCHRGSQSLSLYFRERGLTLSGEAAKYQIRDLWSLPAPGKVDYRRPALVTCVGLPVLDLYLTQHVFETSREQGDLTRARALT
jgi:alanine dehydrogenase